MRFLRFVAWYFAFSGLAVLCWLVMNWPRHPSNADDWLMLAVGALPVTLLGEGRGTLLFGIQRPGTRSRFSPLRVLVGVVLLAAVVVLTLAIVIWMNTALG
ncbi:hypothetical protein [Diaphorobacter caeni]|uniref:hypothetical protein n=1 Tax=Diaphorobacter caeni TaxID=2784387 RepID=UPI00188FD2D4|nr:hypothetical protein [Diaphorobacter caeni]MBF5003210.1 hypothetical protein [Diaphorobacter caeni]